MTATVIPAVIFVAVFLVAVVVWACVAEWKYRGAMALIKNYEDEAGRPAETFESPDRNQLRSHRKELQRLIADGRGESPKAGALRRRIDNLLAKQAEAKAKGR